MINPPSVTSIPKEHRKAFVDDGAPSGI